MTWPSLRIATPADISALAELEQNVFDSDRISRRSWRKLVASSSAKVVLGEALGELCGSYVLLFSTRTSVARLYSIAVGRKWRRRGVARLMLEDAIVRAICRGATRLRLETRADNHRAQALFESLGFESFDRTPDYYEDGEQALRYERYLDIGKI